MYLGVFTWKLFIYWYFSMLLRVIIDYFVCNKSKLWYNQSELFISGVPDTVLCISIVSCGGLFACYVKYRRVVDVYWVHFVHWMALLYPCFWRGTFLYIGCDWEKSLFKFILTLVFFFNLINSILTWSLWPEEEVWYIDGCCTFTRYNYWSYYQVRSWFWSKV
jgi:hypothetical protein